CWPNAPRCRCGSVLSSRVKECLGNLPPLPVVLSQTLTICRLRKENGPVYLAAGRLVLINEKRPRSKGRYRRCRGKSGRPGPNDDDVISIGEVLDRVSCFAPHGGCHCAGSADKKCEPFWVSTVIPSCTGTRHPCRLPTPSILTRHSKQTPIMQYGPRCAPDTGVVRQARIPAARSAAATLSPADALIGIPS